MNESIIKDTNLALDILGSPLTPTQYFSHNSQEGGGKQKEGKRKKEGEIKWIKKDIGGKNEKREEGRGKELLSYDFCLSYDKLVQIFYCFYLLMKCFCLYYNKEEVDLNIFTPEIIFILF